MAIPSKVSPAPKQSQVFYRPGVGVTTLPVSVARKEIQKTNGAASMSNSLVASGSGAVTISSVNLSGGTYTVNVPINIPTPLTAQTPLALTVGTPSTAGLKGLVIVSLTAAPLYYLVGSATPIGASTIARGQQVRQFAAKVTLQWTGKIATPENLTITVTASLVTTS